MTNNQLSLEMESIQGDAKSASGGLNIVKIQRTCVHDGPGLRTTIFFRGCGLKCKWCQNPETLSAIPSPDDKNYTLQEILEIVSRDREYYIASTGGVTLSGGEPLLQNPDKLLELVKALKAEGLNISAETTLGVPWKNIEAVAQYIDLFLVDFKVVGNDAAHKALTGASDERIRENFEKLVKLGANISLRMVMVPGLNDKEEYIKSAAEYISGYGFTKIEVLKYHNMYEDKAKKLGLSIPMLNITAEQSAASLKSGIELFKKYGIDAYNVDGQSARYTPQFSQRVMDIQKDIRDAKRALSIEVALLKTKYYKKFRGWKKPAAVHRGERLNYVLKNKTIKVYPKELLVGNFTEKRVAGQIWEEQYGVLYISFLYQINRQKPVNFQCSFKERMNFYFKVFPHWLKHSIVVKSHPSIKSFIATLARTADMSAGFNNNFAAIAHYIVNFERFLENGTSGLLAEIREKQKANPDNNEYKGMIASLEGLEAFGERYAKLLAEEAANEKDPIRKKELEQIAANCARVPKYPATNYREALQSMLLLQIGLCTEAYENAVSLGRLDQILYPYYKKDVEAGILTYEEAKELLCLFVLKLDEAILVNDGDGFLSVGRNFETLSTDQALTFGGLGKDGYDATNDLTYMLIDACELEPLAVNMVARVHDGSPDRYMERLAEIYINGCPMPEMFADNIYVDSLQRHYPGITVEDARNYSIVGCVEPCCSDDHFGNTDCANMNLALPFLQALKGTKYDLWNYGFGEQIEKFVTKVLEYGYRKSDKLPKVLEKREKKIEKKNRKRGRYNYKPVQNMDQLLTDFQLRLNELALSILTDQQRIERTLQSNFITPLCSSLYRGCVERGMDAYEGGTDYNTAGIQAVGVTDVADSLYAINEIVFKRRLYTVLQVINAIDANFEGEANQRIKEALLSVPKFGEDGENEAAYWVSKVMEIYNKALEYCPYKSRNGQYTAGYYALNVNDRYGKKTQALPSGRLKGVPLANSVTPHYGMEQADLMSALNSMSQVNFTDYAVNGATATLSIDAALFPGEGGKKNLGAIFKTYLTKGGIQIQPNVISRELLLEAYHNPEKHKYLMVRVAGYCAYFQELSDDLKLIIINRTCYS